MELANRTASIRRFTQPDVHRRGTAPARTLHPFGGRPGLGIAVRPLPRPVPLAAIKAEPSLAKMELIRQSRLSVAPVRPEEWAKLLEMSSRS